MNSQLSDSINNRTESNKEKNQEKENKIECRYCLSDDFQEDLICPCSCEGSMKFVHQKCLEGWIESSNRSIKQIKEQNESYFSLSCELCSKDMKYKKLFKNGIFISLHRLALKIFKSFKSTILLAFRIYFCYLLMKRSSIIFNKIQKKIFNFDKEKKFTNFFHYLWVLIGIGFYLDNTFSLYRNMYLKERGQIIKFETKYNINNFLK